MKLLNLIILIVLSCAASDVDCDNNQFVYIQISDTHLSTEPTSSTKINFRLFTELVLPQYNPELVIHTGDITDGWMGNLKTGDVKEEWIMYKDILEDNGYFNSTRWLDVRGNHDNSYQDSSTRHSYYDYSNCGRRGPIFHEQYEREFGKYCFIGIDATLSPSPGVMFTYYGYVPKANQKKLESFLKQDTNECNHTIVFMHYPTIFTNSPPLHTIFNKYSPSFVLAGHVHTTLGSKANAKINSKTIELVVTDFKVQTTFRVLCFDNDYMSYIDVNLDQALRQPVIMVTNPPNSQLYSESQKLEKIGNTKYIHIFVYDVFKKGKVNLNGFTVKIDGHLLKSNTIQNSKNPHLFFIPWNPANYKSGIHSIHVSYNNGDVTSEYSHTFFLLPLSALQIAYTNSSLHYVQAIDYLTPGNNFGGFLLGSQFVPVLITLSFTLSLLLVFGLVGARITLKKMYRHSFENSSTGRFQVFCTLFYHSAFKHIPTFMKCLLLMVSDNLIYYFFVVSLLWQTFGFWAFGKFPKEYGFQTLWGMLFISPTHNGRYSLWLDLYLWHILTLLLFYIPLIGYYCMSMIPHGMLPHASYSSTRIRMLAQTICFLYFVVFLLVIKIAAFWTSFDGLTLLLSPVWTLIPFVNMLLIMREIRYDLYYHGNTIRKETGRGIVDTVIRTAQYTKLDRSSCGN